MGRPVPRRADSRQPMLAQLNVGFVAVEGIGMAVEQFGEPSCARAWQAENQDWASHGRYAMAGDDGNVAVDLKNVVEKLQIELVILDDQDSLWGRARWHAGLHGKVLAQNGLRRGWLRQNIVFG